MFTSEDLPVAKRRDYTDRLDLVSRHVFVSIFPSRDGLVQTFNVTHCDQPASDVLPGQPIQFRLPRFSRPATLLSGLEGDA